MDFFDVQMMVGIKLLSILFVVVGLYLVLKKKNPVYFLGFVGVISAVSYFLLVNDLQLLFWGLKGDEITIAAMYNTFAHVGFGADFAYHGLPPFYPPGFFWFFGAIGGLMNWNGVVIAKFATCCFFLLFPIGLYYYQKLLNKNAPKVDDLPGKIFLPLVPLLILTVLEKDLLIGKPYEIIAAAATIFWYVSLYLKISRGKWSNKQSLVYGIIAGFIFVTYYLWLVFAAMAFFIMGLFEEKGKRVKYFWSLFKTMLVTIVVSLPFLWPLISSYLKNGMESWQTTFFTPVSIELWLPMFELNGFNSLILLFGFATLIYFRNNNFVRQLLYLFFTAFIWWGIGLLSLLLLKKPFQEFRGFYVFGPSILIIAVAYGVEKLWQHFKVDHNKKLASTLLIIGVMFFAAQSVFGFFVDDPIVKERRVESREVDQATKGLVEYLKTTDNSKMTLETAPQVLAFVPINNLIYFNQHNNHPASIFSERFQYVESLAASQTPDELYQKIKTCPFGNLERFILYGKKDDYYLYFDLDKIIVGLEGREIKISKKLFEDKRFEKVYNENDFVIINVK